MSPQARHYSFATAAFRTEAAHGGRGRIRTTRVERRPEQGLANFIDLTVVPPGTSIGEHSHTADNEEIYVVVSGRGRMRVDGSEIVVGPGDVIVNRRSGTHGLEPEGDDEVRLVVIEIPAPEAVR